MKTTSKKAKLFMNQKKNQNIYLKQNQNRFSNLKLFSMKPFKEVVSILQNHNENLYQSRPHLKWLPNQKKTKKNLLMKKQKMNQLKVKRKLKPKGKFNIRIIWNISPSIPKD